MVSRSLRKKACKETEFLFDYGCAHTSVWFRYYRRTIKGLKNKRHEVPSRCTKVFPSLDRIRIDIQASLHVEKLAVTFMRDWTDHAMRMTPERIPKNT